METNYSAQVDTKTGKYTLQFETSNLELFKIVEKACHAVMNKKDKYTNLVRGKSSSERKAGYI